MGRSEYTKEEQDEIIYQAKVLSYKYDAWKKAGNGYTHLCDVNGKLILGEDGKLLHVKRNQISFAKKLFPYQTNDEDGKSRQSKFSKMLRGARKITSDELETIVDILNAEDVPTRIEEFYNTTNENHHTKEEINQYIVEHYGDAITFGLLDSFLLFLQFIKDNSYIEKRFPLWTEIRPANSQKDSIKRRISQLSKSDPERIELEHLLKNGGYMRALYNTIPDVELSDFPEFQFNTKSDGKKPLQLEDILFLRDVREKVYNYMIQLFNERKEAMKQEVQRADYLAYMKHSDKKKKEELSEEEHILVDPYYCKARKYMDLKKLISAKVNNDPDFDSATIEKDYAASKEEIKNELKGDEQ